MDDLLRIPQRLARLWKDFFGLYTQYVGYFTPEMIKTVLQIKRGCDSSLDEEFAGMSLSQLNEYARRHGFHELPDMEEIDDVLPLIRNYLKEYDLSDSAVSSEKWNELMEYIDLREARRKLRGTEFL